MTLWTPTEAELYETGTQKWSGVKTTDGESTLGAWVAEMDFGTSPTVKARLQKAVEQGFLGYPPAWAGEAVKEALVELEDRRYGWVIKPGWVTLAPSILASLRVTIDALTRPGSAVIVPTPAYMPFLTIPAEHGRDVIEIPSLHNAEADGAEDAWALNLIAIEEALQNGAGLVVLCNPWNPTGRSLNVAELQGLHAVVGKYDALVFADEVHAPLVLGDPGGFVSYASLGPDYAAHTVTAVAASKAWNVAGLNCAQVILPDAALRQKYENAPKSRFGYPAALGQLATVPAYLESDEWLVEAIAQINANLDLLGEALQGTDVDYHRPEATYLTWLGFDAYPELEDPAVTLREEYRVGVNDGATLGRGYERWIRVNAAMSPEPWKKVVAAIADLANGYGPSGSKMGDAQPVI